jgi:hypothetical protein
VIYSSLMPKRSSWKANQEPKRSSWKANQEPRAYHIGTDFVSALQGNASVNIHVHVRNNRRTVFYTWSAQRPFLCNVVVNTSLQQQRGCHLCVVRAVLPVLIVIKREVVTKVLINPTIRNRTRHFVACTTLHVTICICYKPSSKCRCVTQTFVSPSQHHFINRHRHVPCSNYHHGRNIYTKG